MKFVRFVKTIDICDISLINEEAVAFFYPTLRVGSSFASGKRKTNEELSVMLVMVLVVLIVGQQKLSP